MAQSQKVAHRPRGRALRAKRSRRLPLLMIVLALGVLLGGALIVSKLAQPAATVTPFTARTLNAPTGVTPEGYAYKGSPDAAITVIEYGDFQCPSCAAFATQQEAAFLRRVAYRHGDRTPDLHGRAHRACVALLLQRYGRSALL